MQNVWQESPNSRLKLWRKFRKDLSLIDDDDQVLHAIIDWWKGAPIESRILDCYNSDNWPDPWELIYNDKYDDNAVALGMCYTMDLIDWPCTLQLIQCNKKSEIKLILNIDDVYILNYTYGIINDIDDISHCEILQSWESNELTK